MRAWKISRLQSVTGIGETTIKEAISAGDLVRRYPSSHPVVIESELRAWLSSLPTEPGGARVPATDLWESDPAVSWNLSSVPDLIDVGITTLKNAIARGDLLKRHASTRPVIYESDLDSWLESLPTERP